jgi:methionyl aminopeptidase
MIKLKTEEDLQLMRVSGKILARTLREVKSAAGEGVTLSSLDKIAKKFITEAGATPTFLGYRPEGAEHAYPAAICASVNETIVHGIPGKYVLKNGDILSIDLGVTYKGRITDAAITFGIGDIDSEATSLIRATEKALTRAIVECVPGKHVGDIGHVIEDTAKKASLHVVHGLTGHGVGIHLHEDPSVYNYGTRGEGAELVAGLVLAIEPMFAVGSPYAVVKKDDSFATKDKSLSAHFEHTVAITEHGPEVLTKE